MDSGLLTTLTHQAMATQFSVILPASQAAAADAVLEALEMLDAIEARLTVYQPDSEVSKINRHAAVCPVEVSPDVFTLLQRALYWSQQTGGAFDITAGPLVQTWGFTKRTGRKPTAAEIQSALRRVGYQKLILNDEDHTVAFAVDGMSINLGGIGKGYALDRLAETLTQRGVENFLLHGGQSSVVARGDQEPDQSQADTQKGTQKGWAIGISHPTKPQHRVAGIWLRDTALGTSGSGKQFFHHQGRRYGHVIDPRTGYPAGDLLSLTVLSQSATDADASGTGYFVAGSEVIAKLHESGDADHWPGSMLAIGAGARQDSVELQAYGPFAWVDES